MAGVRQGTIRCVHHGQTTNYTNKISCFPTWIEKSPSLHVTLFMVHITDLLLSLSGKRLQNTTVQCNIRLAECVPSRNGHKLRFREKKKRHSHRCSPAHDANREIDEHKTRTISCRIVHFSNKTGNTSGREEEEEKNRNKATLFTIFKLYQRWGTLVIRAVYGATDQRSKQIDQWILGLNTRGVINWILMKLFIGSVVYVG